MSKFTTEVRYICETANGLTESVGLDRVPEIIAGAEEDIFGGEGVRYPIFDENYRSVLNYKILSEYYTREICEETVGLWKLRLRTRMNKIMPYYNQLYRSQLLEFNPLYTIDLTKDSKRVKEDEARSNAVSSNTGANVSTNEVTGSADGATSGSETNGQWDKYSDTPQGGLNNITESPQYLTNIRNIDETNTNSGETHSVSHSTGSTNINTRNDGSSTSTNNLNSTDEYIEHIKGINGSVSNSKLLLEFRETFLNIDRMIIEELGDLFFGLWD